MPWWGWLLVVAWLAPGAWLAAQWHRAKGISLVWFVALLLFTPLVYLLGWTISGLQAVGLMKPPDERYARLEAELQRIGITPTLDGGEEQHWRDRPEGCVRLVARDYLAFDGWQERLGWEAHEYLEHADFSHSNILMP